MEKTLFFHGVTTDNRRFTIAGKIEKNSLLLGAAICSVQDAFIKRKGRLKAEARLKLGKSVGKQVVELFEIKRGKEIASFIGIASQFNSKSSYAFQKYFSLWKKEEKNSK